MRRTMLLKITGLDHSEEEEKMKKIDKEEGIKKNNKEEAKLHHPKTPLLKQPHHRMGRFLKRNLQQGRRHTLISPNWRPRLWRTISV
jgi:hypothetical protein